MVPQQPGPLAPLRRAPNAEGRALRNLTVRLVRLVRLVRAVLRARRAARAEAAESHAEDPLAGAFSVGLVEGAAVFMVVSSIALLTVGHTENVEFGLYLVAFAVALPLAVVSALWRRRSLTPEALSVLGVVDATALACALAVGRLAEAGPRPFLLVGVAILASNELLMGPLRRFSTPVKRPLLDALALALLFVAFLSFLPTWTYESPVFWLAFPVAALLALAGATARRPHRALVALDVVVVLLIAATVWDVYFWGVWMLDNHNYYLGPVNELLHGRTMLVDDFAQYGVGVMYFLAGLFTLIPIGYGTFALVISALTVLELVLLYAIVRIAGRSQLIAVLAAAVAIVFVIFGTDQSQVPFPSTGPLRFGLPYVVVLLEVLAVRRGGRVRGLQTASAAVAAVASLWSFETFAYVLVAYLAIVALEAIADRESMREVFWRRLLPLVEFVIFAQVLFAAGTRLASGSWPDWKTYLDYIRLYSVQGFYTLPMEPWSSGFLLAGLCFASALVLVVVAVRRPELVRARRDLFVALSGSTAFAILAFSYFIGRSHPNNLHHVAPPVIMVGALWVCLLVDRGVVLRPPVRVVLLAAAAWSAIMLVDGSHGELEAKWRHSALGTLLADGPSALADRVTDLTGRPVLLPEAPEAVALLEQADPGSSRSLVLLEPELTTEVLLRADRGNAVPIATPPQDVILPAAVRRVLDAVPRLSPGTIMLADARYLAAPAGSYPNPSLTQLAVWEVQRFFSLETVGEAGGIVAVRLERSAG